MAVGFGVATAVTSSVLNWIDPEYVLRSESPLAIERIDARGHLWMLGLLLATLILAAFGLGTLKKSNLQLWYGGTEIVVSVAWICLSLVRPIQGTPITRVAYLLASIYVLRRGADNVLDGFPKWIGRKEAIR